MPPSRLAVSALLALLFGINPSGSAVAKEAPGQDSPSISGIDRERREPSDTARAVGNGLLVVPRTLIDWTFAGTFAVANLVANKQLVPRYRDALGTPGGDIFLFPTVFAETDAPLNLGARVIIKTRHVSSSFRTGYGGNNNLVVEGRLGFRGGGTRLPFTISLEGLHERRSDQDYYGLGLTPLTDSRNIFRSRASGREPSVARGQYFEERERLIAGIAWRLTHNFEFYVSGSIGRRVISDDPDGELAMFSAVFEPESVAGFGSRTWLTYLEGAVQFDSRKSTGRPSPGFLLESYVGGAQDIFGTGDVAFARLGFRAAGFIPIYRRRNILSPRLVVDRLQPLGGLEVPFIELPRQPEFRGFDHRRDALSIVASLDYAWELVPFMGMRIFADGATVAPRVQDLDVRDFVAMCFAAGLGIDLYSSNAEIGRLTTAFSNEGVNVLLAFGVSSRYGDRQHRD